ncbi:MAG: FAD/NAD(P)-binding domain-containing protein [Haliangiales bacterium]
MTTSALCIIGLGPRGLTVFERIIAHARQRPRHRLHVHIAEPREPGVGLHAREQPDYLLLNTVCGQVGMFPDPASVAPGTATSGPDLWEWASAEGHRFADDGVHVRRGEGRPLRPSDYLPRRLLGAYLAWFYEHLRAQLPDNIELHVHRQAVTDLRPLADGREQVTLDDGASIAVDHVFLTTGHTERATPARADRMIHRPYPPTEMLADVEPGQKVGIAGFGLTAMDAIAALTLGRGGRYQPTDDGRLRYVPSGREPQLVLFSRSGLPYRARPMPHPDIDVRYQAVRFTAEAIEALRRDSPGGRLDFRAQVLPLLFTEMRFAYYRHLLAATEAAAAADDLAARGRMADDDAIETLLAEQAQRHGNFDPAAYVFVDVAPGCDSGERYQAWLTELIADDLAMARRGLAGSPVKAALELFRSLRDVIRLAVDFSGLTRASHEEFASVFVSLMNRVVIGPQLDRHSELLALMEAGLLRAPFGPAPSTEWDPQRGTWRIASTQLQEPHTEDVDWICAGYCESPAVRGSASALLRSLFDQRRIGCFEVGEGIDLDADLHPRAPDGSIQTRIWVLGPLAEGVSFYNHYVPSPRSRSRALVDADRCVAQIFADQAVVAAPQVAQSAQPRQPAQSALPAQPAAR